MNYAILLLAGSSSRFENKTKKQFYLIKSKQIYSYSLETLNNHKLIDGIIIVTLENKIKQISEYCRIHKFKKIINIVSGGKTRTESVEKGISALKNNLIKNDDLVLIHDAARPFVNDENITQAINETKKKKATTFAKECFDTIVEANVNKQVNKYLKRESTFLIQTPQTFQFKLINLAYNKKRKAFNDDTELVFNLNVPITLLKGGNNLDKITELSDIKKMEVYAK